jgi:PAS domain S-box-containing protein
MESDAPGLPTGTDRQVVDLDALRTRSAALEAEVAELRHASEQTTTNPERRRRIVEDALDHVIITLDPDGYITDWSRGAANILGWSKGEVLGHSGSLIFTPEDRAAGAPEEEQRTARQKGVAEDERWHICKDGRRLWLSGSLVPLRNAAGALEGFLKVARDETKRRLAEEALRESEAHFRTIADNIPQMAWMARGDGGRYWFNRRWHDYTGQSPQQAQGVGWREVHHPDHLDRVLEGMRRAWKAGEPWEDTFLLRGKDGDYRWFLARAVPVHDAQGQVARWFGTNTDVTGQHAIEAALRDESRTLEVLNQTGAVLAAELDLGNIVQKVTDAATELSGAAFGAFFYNVVDESEETYTLYALSGASRDAFAKYPLPRSTAVFGPTFRAEGIIRSEDITQDPRYGRNAPHHGMPEGHLPVRSYLAVPVVSRSGEVLGGLFFGHPEPGVFAERAERVVTGIAAQAAIAVDNARLYQAAQREVAARKAAENDLRRLNETLERLVEERTAALLREVEERRRAEEALRQGEKLQALGQLTGGIAHDFNNIVQVIASGATLLQHPGLHEERQAAILNGLTKAAQNAKELTGRLLAFARRQALQPEAFDLNARLEGMVELLRRTLGSRIRVETDFAIDLWPAQADPNQLEVAVLNLAANARDAMPPEGGVLTLTTRNATLKATPERAAGEYVCLAVKDTGKGMSSAVLARAFEPFFTTKGPDLGTGLGLAQVHGFAKQSGGDIAVESTPGQGTIIFFHLPRATTAEVERQGTMARAAEPAGTAWEHRESKTVLVVDDNPDVASFAATMLEGLGYTTRRAANAGEALSVLETDKTVDAVFSDVVMPGDMDGVQLASTLRLHHPHLAVVLATGYSETLAEWQGEVVAEVLSKPYRLDDVVAALERALVTAQTLP